MRKEKNIRVLPSSPDFEEINMLNTKIAMLKNPHLHNVMEEVPQAEAAAILVELEHELQELLNFQALPFNSVLVGLR